MCGRYTLRTPLQHVIEAVAPLTLPFEYAVRYNIAPTQSVPVVRLDAAGERKLGLVHWGLIPSWAKDPSMGNRMINARAETVATKPAYRSAFERRRCLIPADGFYEWKRNSDGKQPMLITHPDHSIFCFAGLWERWKDPQSDTVVDSMAIITTQPNEVMKSIHDRMPVIISPDNYDRWLNKETDANVVSAMLAPYSAKPLATTPVSRTVNNARNDSAVCAEPWNGH